VTLSNFTKVDIKEEKEKGLPRPLLTALAYSLPGFAEKKYAKPAHECYLQEPSNAARAINDALTSR
jgi:hypothetical protein